MFTTITTKFNEFFSRSFWFGAFLPVAIFTTAHLAIAYWQFPETVKLTTWIEDLDTWKSFPFLFASLVVIAYALRPFASLIRGILDGRRLPTRLHNALATEHREATQKARALVRKAWDLWADYNDERSGQIADYLDAREQGNRLKAASDEPSVAAAEKAIDALDNARAAIEKQWEASAILPVNDTKDASKALVAALKANSADLDENASDARRAQRLARLHDRMREFLRVAEARALNDHARVRRLHASDLLLAPEATRAGAVRAIAEYYPLTVYNADFEFLWPRLLLLTPKDDTDPFAIQLSDAQSQIDFAALALALALSLGFWLPYFAATGVSPWPFLTVGMATPLLVRFFYELLVQSQVAFGEVVKTTIDTHRLELFDRLHLPRPASLAEERSAWGRLRVATEDGRVGELVYVAGNGAGQTLP